MKRLQLRNFDSKILKVATIAILGPFMTSLDSTVVNIALPVLSREFNASVNEIQWIISGYLLALALTLPMSGWLVDKLGAKKVYLWCFTAFTLSSVLCGTANSSSSLIFYRVLQGMAGGLLAPMAQMMIARVAGKRLADIMGIIVLPVLLAPILGPVVAGVILQHTSWRWLFYLNLPIGLVALIAAIVLLPKDEKELLDPRPFDFRGFFLLSPGLALLLFGMENASTHGGLRSLIVGASLLGGFFWHTRHTKTMPIIDLQLFRSKIFLTASITQFIANGVTFSGQMLIPLYLMSECHLSAQETGLLIVPMGLGMMITYPFIGFFNRRFGCRLVSAGGALISLLATLPLVWMAEHGLVKWVLNIALLMRGIGLSGINIPSMAAAYGSVPRRKLPIVTTTINIIQRIGGPIATTVLAVYMGQRQSSDVFTEAFIFLCGIQLANFIAACFLPARVSHETNESDLQAIEALTD